MQPITLAAPALEHVFDLVATVTAPIDGGMVQGRGTVHTRRIIPITGGLVTGQLTGEVLPGGADFQRVVSATTNDLDARYLIALSGEFAGEHIFVMNHALRRASVEDAASLARGQTVDPARVYFRGVPQFEVSTPRLAWLTESVFLAVGARHPSGVNISFYRVL
jgi:Protein of unknown function (DUF3237)